MKLIKQLEPPKIDWAVMVRQETKHLPEGVVTEYASGSGREISTALAQMNGRHPVTGWFRNREVDMWYLMLRGELVITMEGRAPRTIRAGEWFHIPKGAWYRDEFKNAVLEIPTVPAWTLEQTEQKP
jgi:mannose-6-phosphate isomerase-like protein (cupin superfamily)